MKGTLRLILNESLERRCCLSAVAFIPRPDVGIWGNPAQGGFREVQVADLDSDDDFDLIVSSLGHGNSWYRNVDGLGDFSFVEGLGGRSGGLSVSGTRSIALADLDGDGDDDMVAADYFQGSLYWAENVDGLGHFQPRMPETLIDLEAIRPSWVGATDMDGDGDLDVLVVEQGELGEFKYDQGAITWYENVDGQGDFGPRQLISDETGSNCGVFSSIQLADVDGDGDSDIISKHLCKWPEPVVNPLLSWYENMDGHGSFGPPQAIHSERGAAYSTDVVDIDGDGDLDILSTTGGPGWDPLVVALDAYSNSDGDGNFGSAQPIGILGADIVRNGWAGPSLAAADLDGDDDIDVVVMGYLNGKMIWYENTDGTGGFATEQVIFTASVIARSAAASDLDGDGDMDLIAAFDDRIIWYENRLIGDSNNDAIFDSSDLVIVFAAGKYEDDTPGNATFDEGDWNQDGDFDSGDLVLAFQAGRYEAAAAPHESQIAAAVDLIFSGT